MAEISEQLKSAFADRYLIEGELGAGGMATVYLARDLKHERLVALKVLRPELAAALGAERFTREIRIAAQLQHPHILPLHDSGEAAGFLYYVMPYVEGESLRDRLNHSGELPIDDAVRIIREIVDALAHAHEHGVVHRDLKPDNVMLSKRHALVMDFGVAKAVSEATGRHQLTTSGVALGTPAYMAPEQATANPLTDHRADIYAVGVVAYELLTGSPPFGGPNPQAILSAHVMQEPAPVTVQRASVPAPLAEVVMRCLAKKPADRWQSADDMLLALEGLTTTSGAITPAQTRPLTAVGIRNRNTGLIAAALVGAGALAAVGFLLRGGTDVAVYPAPVDRRVTFRGDVDAVALARDGRTIAYQAEEGRALIVQDLAGGGFSTLVRLEDPALIMNEPYWGPEDARVFFNLFSDTSDFIASVPRLGGPLRTEFDLQGPSRPPDWFRGFTASGEYIITTSFWIYVGTAPETVRWVTEDSLAGDGALLKLGAGSDVVISAIPSPDGRWIAYGMAGEGTLFSGGVVAIDGSRHTNITADATTFIPVPLGWSADSEAVYYPVDLTTLSGGIMKVQLDLSAGALAYDPTDVYRFGTQQMVAQAQLYDNRLVYVGGARSSNLMAIDLGGAPRAAEYPTSMLTSGTAMNLSPALTPDGGTAIFERYTGETTDLYRRPTRDAEEPLVVYRGGRGIATLPAISRDGRRLAFYELQPGGSTKLVVLDIATGRVTALPLASGQWSAGWSPDGQQIATNGVAEHQLTLVNLRDSSEVTLALECDTPCVLWGARPVFSPDGTRIALGGTTYGLWVATLPDGRATRIATDALRPLNWTRDGIYVVRVDTAASGKGYPGIYRIAADGGAPQLYAHLPDDCSTYQLALSLDASMAVCEVSDDKRDVHIVENFDRTESR